MHCPLRGQSITPIGGNASKTKFLIDCLLRRQCIARIFCFEGNAKLGWFFFVTSKRNKKKVGQASISSNLLGVSFACLALQAFTFSGE